MTRVNLLATLLVCSQLIACQYQTNDTYLAHEQENRDKTLNAITLSNGQKVINCAQYNIARASHMPSDTISNSIISSEYLPCSLSNTNSIDPKEAALVAKQLLSARVRQFPLSIAQLFGRKTTLLNAGFIQQNNKLLWSAKQQNIVVQVKAKAVGTNTQYLIWVSDVILDGNYYAYYPAWIKVSPESNTIKVFPLYQSGY